MHLQTVALRQVEVVGGGSDLPFLFLNKSRPRLKHVRVHSRRARTRRPYLLRSAALAQLVKDVVVALARAALDHANLLKQIVRGRATGNHVLLKQKRIVWIGTFERKRVDGSVDGREERHLVEENFHVLSETGRVVISDGFGVSETLQNGVGYEEENVALRQSERT